ncbi:MAG: hypothetical protein Q8N60_05185 [Candidatus Diapherotrites archaeon]|nr:hypothetical protein [Candidatus Diapherotrites archaeon]
MAGEHRGSTRGRGRRDRAGIPAVGAYNIRRKVSLVGKRQLGKGAASLDSIPLGVRRKIRAALVGGKGADTVAKNIIMIAINHAESIEHILELMLNQRKYSAVKAKIEQILAEMRKQRDKAAR